MQHKRHKRLVVIGYYLRALWLTNAFVLFCLAFQIRELLGPNGVLSAEKLLNRVDKTLPGTKLDQFLKYPTIFLFIGTSENVLLLVCIAGTLSSILAATVGGITAKFLSCIAAYLLLSIIVVGGDFCQFPWDFLLLEAHLIAMFLPRVKPIWKGLGAVSEPLEIPLLATHFLLFRFMWAMGIEKLPFINGEKHWVNLTYLSRFYETEQPLPTAASWLLTKFPMWFHKACAYMTWFVELFIPLLIFLSPKWQYISVIFQAILMVAIYVVGNYATFQVITIVLMIPLLTDTYSSENDRVAGNDDKNENNNSNAYSVSFYIYNTVRDTFLILHGTLGIFYLLRIFEPGGLTYLGNSNWLYSKSIENIGTKDPDDFYHIKETIIPVTVLVIMKALHPFRVVNQYGGIFHDTFSHEGHVALIVQGSNDGRIWQDYELAYSIQHEHSFPQYFAPWMPRLDHAAFYEGTRIPFYFIQPSNPLYHQGNTWFLNFVQMLLDGNPYASSFFSKNPFSPSSPPKYVKAVTRSFKFSTYNNLQNNGKWFEKEFESIHLPPVSNCKKKNYEGKCEAMNCISVLTYYKIPLDNVANIEECRIKNLKQNNINSLWSYNELDVVLATEMIPFSYRFTIWKWLKKKYCNNNDDGDNEMPLQTCTEFIQQYNNSFNDIKKIGIITDCEYIIRKNVRAIAKKYNVESKKDLDLCMKDVFIVFLNGDVDQNGFWSDVEIYLIFLEAGVQNPAVTTMYLFESQQGTIAADGLSFEQILSVEIFIIEQCGFE
jgi:lipase maturation factor 1